MRGGPRPLFDDMRRGRRPVRGKLGASLAGAALCLLFGWIYLSGNGSARDEGPTTTTGIRLDGAVPTRVPTVAVADPTPSSFAGAARDGTRARPTRELDLSRPHHREAAAREAASDALAKHVGDDRHALFEKGGTFTPGGDALKAKVAEARGRGAPAVNLRRGPANDIDPAAYPDARALATLMHDLALPRGELVAVTFADSKFAALTVNWATHLRDAAVPHVVGALDKNMLQLLRRLGAPTAVYDLPYADLDGSSSHKSKSWKAFARLRISQVSALLRMGFDVLMSDVDVVWTKDPRPFLQCGYDHPWAGRTGKGAGEKDAGRLGAAGETGDGLEKWERDAVEMEGGESPDEQAMFLRKHGRGVDDCMGVSAADVMVSSDNLSPLTDKNEGAAYARGGIFNTGVVFLKHTKNAKAFAEAWNDNLNQDEGRFAPLTSDQQVFNAMVRREGHWPGLELKALPDGFPVTRVLVGNGLPNGEAFNLGVLPVALFQPGHVAFLQRVKEVLPDFNGPYGVHATYTFDGSTSSAKRLRFAEAGLWDPAADDAQVGLGGVEADDATFHAGGVPRVLTWDPAVATRGIDESVPNIGSHLEAGGRQLELLRDAIAMAQLTNRTLAVPRFTCFCDKVWGGHDNIFNFNCHYPGSKDSGHIPGPCPMDHFVSPAKLRESGVAFVALEELRRAPYEFGGDDFGAVRVEFKENADAGGGVTVVTAGGGRGVTLPVGADSAVVVDALGKLRDVPLLKLTGEMPRFAGFTTQRAAREFNARVTNVAMKSAPEWCSECHPQGCRELIPADVITSGRLKPVRNVHDQFCADFKQPEPLRTVGKESFLAMAGALVDSATMTEDDGL